MESRRNGPQLSSRHDDDDDGNLLCRKFAGVYRKIAASCPTCFLTYDATFIVAFGAKLLGHSRPVKRIWKQARAVAIRRCSSLCIV